jgi:murein L,D-transpeptidase YafK
LILPNFSVLLMSIAVGLVLSQEALSEPQDLFQLRRPKHSEYSIAVHCSRKLLQLWRKDELVKEYPVEIGKGGLDKRRGGDRRTPLGDYEISWMASRYGGKGHQIVDKRSWCKDNRFSSASTGPVLEKLWTDTYGGDQAAIMSIDYPNEFDKLRGRTGECIHIHSDKHHVGGALKKSYGCIHMYPKDANELYKMVDVGAPVKILP